MFYLNTDAPAKPDRLVPTALALVVTVTSDVIMDVRMIELSSP